MTHNQITACLVLVLGVAVGLQGCIYIISNERTPVVVTVPTPVKQHCYTFVPPEPAPIPILPTLTVDQLHSRDASETILVNHIKELREYARSMQANYDTAYRRYRAECQ